MKPSKLFVIGHVWPEPTSSAAGWRMLQLLFLFQKNGYEVIFASAAAKSPFSHDLTSLNITEILILLNDSSFDTLIGDIQPDVVMFDRFMIEEQYGWRVQQSCPNALRVLDTEDLHFVRHARMEAYRKKIDWNDDLLFSDLAKREIASILRSDLSLIISKKEMDILCDKFQVSDGLLQYLPFLEEEQENWKSFEEREHFIFIGNFIHEPNWQTVQSLKAIFWPLIRKRLSKAELHIYGAYSSQKVLQLNNPKEGFIIKDRAENARKTISQYKVLLAPIPFGAGLKGKFIDAMLTGTPSVTTSMGAEGMTNQDWPGIIVDEPQLFADAAIKLYNEELTWNFCRLKIEQTLQTATAPEEEQMDFINRVDLLQANLQKHRNKHFIGQILQSQGNNASKYMSLWIEEKNKSL